MKEFINTLLDTSKERIKNPLIGSFLFSFLAFNWKPIFIILFEDVEIQQRIKIIESNYVSTLNGIILPVVFSIFYVLLLPYLMYLFDKLSYSANIGRKLNQIKQQKEEVTHKIELAKTEREYENARAGTREIAELNDQIELLKSDLINKENVISKLRSESKENQKFSSNLILENTTNKNKLEIEYEDFKNSKLFSYFENIYWSIQNTRYIPDKLDERIVEKFKALELISPTYDNDMFIDSWSLTQKGELFWKKYILEMDIDEQLDQDGKS